MNKISKVIALIAVFALVAGCTFTFTGCDIGTAKEEKKVEATDKKTEDKKTEAKEDKKTEDKKTEDKEDKKSEDKDDKKTEAKSKSAEEKDSASSKNSSSSSNKSSSSSSSSSGNKGSSSSSSSGSSSSSSSGSSSSGSSGGSSKPAHTHSWQAVYTTESVYAGMIEVCTVCQIDITSNYTSHLRQHALDGVDAGRYSQPVYKNQSVLSYYKCSCGATK